MDWLKNTIRQLLSFTRFVIINFINDDCTYRASALAFTSLLAVVPLMTVGLAIFSSFPVFQGLVQPTQDFIFQNFVPATGKMIQNYLQLFTSQVSRLPTWGIVFLIISALLVMFTIERAMNKIWHVTTPRHGATAFLLYWAILSLAPIFLGLSLAASSYLISVPIIRDNSAPSLLLNSAPYLLSLIGFTFLYVVVPNHPVKLSHGLIGGIVATILFESAKLAFAYYLTQYNTYQLLYGAFATVPIFFIWVYWVWFITLLGAEICYALSVTYRRRVGEPLQGFIHVLLWLKQLWLAQQQGQGLCLQQLIESSAQPYAVDADEIIERLTAAHLIHCTADDQFMLSRDISKLSVYALSQLIPYRLPAAEDVQNLSKSWRAVFIQANDALSNRLSLNLEQLFSLKE
ncbi:YihY family inner membrane protein [Legionella taurinensis]|uniref:UPF0761 membrane protein D6J04_13235 n=1 Tax=Legionella taurinensis TaxID=70611 RepID=A0A3A5L5W2_9GAMM|nr:YihY family inner membrane protein [Legionella taurinensis]MDX1838766.1 YihY family inner membrane protein [Legionella taurinensis]PUT38630.1 hypothetical protein DB744_13475 [Legionella taurinensis]PUT39828.1 hypothetical protein DB746_12875 [Legionella taurinensis]PUT41820.1 hypothetical protein DB743_13360 [Legionella taurinensis]PUT45315.1 hypothetical protein DB745_12815 [Legionella taurinensis]